MTNDAPTPHLDPELIDELCSADLDGELDAACADHGIGVADARVAIEAHSARRGELAGAGARVAALTADDELDELERRRMSRAATSRATRRASVRDRRARVLTAVASIAATAAAVTAVVVLTRGGGNSSSKSAGTTAPHATAAATTPATVDVGTITDGRDLARRLHVTAAPQPSALGHSASGTPQSQSRGYSDLAASTTGPSTRAGAAGAAAPARCLPGLPLAAGATGVRIVAAARYQGEALNVARGTLGTTVVLWAFRPADCSVAVFYTGS